jgi:hypothetical protein
VLYPAVAEAAHRVGADAIGLIDVGGSNLQVDRVAIAYSNGQSLGDPSAPTQVTASLKGEGRLPVRALPEIVTRAGVEALEVPAAVAEVPADALPVVITAWALSRLSREDRLRFLQGLDEAAAARTVAWVSVEGVGVAPAIPTRGDRHASGHSIVGLAVFDRTAVRAEAIGRCWSRGRWLAWLAQAQAADDAAVI